jgi:hypothetical protein
VIKPASNKQVDSNLLPVTIQMPAYNKSLTFTSIGRTHDHVPSLLVEHSCLIDQQGDDHSSLLAARHPFSSTMMAFNSLPWNVRHASCFMQPTVEAG